MVGERLGPEEQKSGRLPGGGDVDIGQEGDFYLGRSRRGHFRQRKEQRNYSVDCLEENQNSWVNSPASATSYLWDLQQVISPLSAHRVIVKIKCAVMCVT